jgi:hypothetical protein
LAAAVHWGVGVRPSVGEQFPAQRPQVALQKVVYSWWQQPLAEPVRLRVVKQELGDEWVSVRQAQGASRPSERL